MNTEIIKKSKEQKKKYLFICIVLFIFELLLFILIELKIFESMDFSIQNSLYKNYSYNEKPYALTFIYYSNKIYVPYLIIIIVNNFFQIYIIYLIYLMYFQFLFIYLVFLNLYFIGQL